MLNVLSGVAATARAPSLFTVPASFPWTPGFGIFKAGSSFSTHYDPQSDKPSGTEIWVSMTGSDGGGDGSEASPYRTIEHARGQGNIIMIKSGFYEDDDASFGMAVIQDTAFIAADGPGTVIFSSNQDNVVWALNSGDVYSATLANTVNDVLDLTYTRSGATLKDGVTGLPLPYDEETSIAAVQANPGSFYYTGTTLYVQTHDSRTPDSDIKPMWEKPIWLASDVAYTLYLDGIEFWGSEALSIYGHTTTESSKVVALDCAFRFAPYGGNVRCDNVKNVRLVRCAVSDCVEDGFKYTNNSTNFTQYILEDNCTAERCGREAASTDNNNCSTGHKDCAILRVGGTYDTSQGPVISDVQGAQSLNIGVTAINAASDSGDADVSDSSFLAGTYSSGNVPARMWLFGCRSSGSGFDRSASTGGYIISDNAFTGASEDGGNNYVPYEDGITPALYDDLTIWYDFSHDDSIELDEYGIVEITDKSAKRINARQNTSGRRLPAPAVVSGKFNGRKVTSPDDRTDDKSIDVQSSATIGDMYIVGSFKDGADSDFDTYNTLIAGTGTSGAPRIMGNISTADILSGGNDMVNGVSINGAAASATVLPLGFSIIRVTPSTPVSDTYTLLRHSINGARGWTGDVAEILVFETEKSTDEDAAIRNYLSAKWGI